MRPFIGTEALAAGELTRGQLRWNYTAIYPNVYLANGAPRTVFTNASAAWLWSGRKGIISGRAAAALYGVGWIDDDVPIELITKRSRHPPDVVICDGRIGEDEVSEVANLRVTTPARTALDLARRLPRDVAVAHLDALASITGVTIPEVSALADRYPRTPGIRQAWESTELMDAGARSPAETGLRLMLLDAGMPKPQTAIALEDPHWEGTMAIGWDRVKVGVDLEESQSIDPYRIVQAVARQELFQRLGWLHIRVLPGHHRSSIIHRVRLALRQRGAI